MCLAEPLVALLTTRSDQSVFCSLARWESPGFSCRSATVTSGSPAPRLPGTGEGSKPMAHVTITTVSDKMVCGCPWKLVCLEHFRSARWPWCREEMTEIKDVKTWTVLYCHPRCLPEGITPPACQIWPTSCPKELGVVLCPAGTCSRGEGDHSVGAGSWICCHEILILCFSY